MHYWDFIRYLTACIITGHEKKEKEEEEEESILISRGRI